MICALYPEPLFFFYVPSLPGLLYYSYIPAIIVALIAAVIVIASDRKSLLNRLLFAICISFLVWTVGTFIDWTNIHSSILLFAWSLLGPAAGFISIFCIYFTYVFIKKQDVGLKTKLVFTALLAPLIILAGTDYTLHGFNLVSCDAFGFEGLTNTAYFPFLGVLAIVWIAVLLIREYRCATPAFKNQIVLMGTGIELFLFSFFFTEFLGQYLTTIGFLPDSQVETYGYFGMIVFVVYLSILIVRFKAFHVSLIASQALVAALLVLIVSQFAFVRGTTNLILNGIALVLTAIIGFVLIRSVLREVKQRERIELLARDLEKANKQQIILIHFITHQIKGFLTKSRNIFSLLMEGDVCVLPDHAKPMIEEGFRSDTKGVETIQEILNAANIKNGKVSYTMETFDLKALVADVVKDLKPAADNKHLALEATLPESLSITGDRGQLLNAIKNIIDNSIKYTPSGSVKIDLSKEGTTALITVQDTGVGITSEDMAHLFTEGGHGKDSQKINVESTGFGLYIVKNIIEAHKGKVWAESQGAGKGSRFIVELPIG